MEAVTFSLPPEFFSQIENIIRKVLSEKVTQEDKLLTSNEVMKLLNISTTTLQNWRDTKKIPFKRKGNKILYIKAEILQSMQQRA